MAASRPARSPSSPAARVAGSSGAVEAGGGEVVPPADAVAARVGPPRRPRRPGRAARRPTRTSSWVQLPWAGRRAVRRRDPALTPTAPGPAARACTPSRWPSTPWPWRWPGCATSATYARADDLGDRRGRNLLGAKVVDPRRRRHHRVAAAAARAVRLRHHRGAPDAGEPMAGATVVGERRARRGARRRRSSWCSPWRSPPETVGILDGRRLRAAGARTRGWSTWPAAATSSPTTSWPCWPRARSAAPPSTSPIPSRCPTATRCGPSRGASSRRTPRTPSRWPSRCCGPASPRTCAAGSPARTLLGPVDPDAGLLNAAPSG